MEKIHIIGSYISPYVRKVLVCLDLKGIPYDIDPIIPFFGNDEFTKLSPIRRIPVYIDSDITLCDSSVICQYLEDRYPTPQLYPASISDRAQARWLEEYADTRMGEAIIWKLFNQVAINPYVWVEEKDESVINKTRETDIPAILNYLETLIPEQGYLFQELSIADISIASFFRNAAFARYTIDPEKWPLTANFVQRVLSLDAFEKLRPFEEKSVRTPIAQHRAMLVELQAPLSNISLAVDHPSRGVMKI